MYIDYVHFYVKDAAEWRNWFVHTLGFQPGTAITTPHTQTELVYTGAVQMLLSAARSPDSPVAQYLHQHPPGVAELTFCVPNLDAVLENAIQAGATVLQPAQCYQHERGYVKWLQVQGWGDLRYTFVERSPSLSLPDLQDVDDWNLQCLAQLRGDRSMSPHLTSPDHQPISSTIHRIDHVVLNVATGDLDRAVDWHEQVLGLQRRQAFAIRTDRSALHSQVLGHPDGFVQFPINEPASSDSQIQEFLDVNRGPGIQHIALQTQGIVSAIAQFRQRGLSFLSVPETYYEHLKHRSGFQLSDGELKAIAAQEILVDWHIDNPQAILLQAFTQAIFGQPTFFFELIERQTYYIDSHCRQAQGFGEGNFQALFEAIEREQMRRGSLGLRTN